MSSVHFSLTIFAKLPSIIKQIGSTRSWRLLLRLVVIAVFISMPVSHVHGENQHGKFSICVEYDIVTVGNLLLTLYIVTVH